MTTSASLPADCEALLKEHFERRTLRQSTDTGWDAKTHIDRRSKKKPER
jgi:hypothetical protein